MSTLTPGSGAVPWAAWSSPGSRGRSAWRTGWDRGVADSPRAPLLPWLFQQKRAWRPQEPRELRKGLRRGLSPSLPFLGGWSWGAGLAGGTPALPTAAEASLPVSVLPAKSTEDPGGIMKANPFAVEFQPQPFSTSVSSVNRRVPLREAVTARLMLPGEPGGCGALGHGSPWAPVRPSLGTDPAPPRSAREALSAKLQVRGGRPGKQNATWFSRGDHGRGRGCPPAAWRWLLSSCLGH